jgi:DNA-binding NarL/FixJ family response regulator
MPHIHVLVRNAPQMLRDILEQVISGEPDMDVIPEPARPDVRSSSDLVVVDAGDDDAAERGRELLREWPLSRVLLIRARGQNVSMYELVPQGRDLGELSPRQLVEAIRSAVHRERTPATR